MTETYQEVGSDLVIGVRAMDIGSMQQHTSALIEHQRHFIADDFQQIGAKRFPKRSAYQKLAYAFYVSTQIVSQSEDRDDEGNLVRARCVQRATLPGGRFADGDGACSTVERRFRSQSGKDKIDHDLPATAATRAYNRAVANVLGFGQVSAEEAEGTNAEGVVAGELPRWARPVPDEAVMGVADMLVDLLLRAGVEHPAEHVKRIGTNLREATDNNVPYVAADFLADIVNSFPADPPVVPAEPEYDPTAMDEPSEPEEAAE